MRKKRMSVKSGVRLATALVLLFATVGVTASLEEPARETEGPLNLQQLVRVDWPQLKQAEQVITTSSLDFNIQNGTTLALTMHLQISADTGTSAPPIALALQNLELPAGQSRLVKVPLNAMRQTETLRRYAGGLRAIALACPAGAKNGAGCQAVSPPDWFLHVDRAGQLRIYDAATLRALYASGDLSQAGLTAQPVRDGDEVAYPDRVVQWVPPGTTLATAPNDGPAPAGEAKQ